MSKTTAVMLAALLLAATALGASQTSSFETVYDAQKDRTTVRLPFSRISGETDRYHSLDFSVYFSYSGKTKQPPESLSLEIVSVVKARRLNSDLHVVFVVDGEELHFGSSRSAIPNPVKGRLWVGERLIFTIPQDKFQRLAAAKELAIKMGGARFPLSDEARESLRAFANEWQ